MKKWSEWNHKRQWEMGENNTRGRRTSRTNENMSKKARQNARENAWERKRQCERREKLWSSSAHKSENEGERQSVKVKTLKLEVPHRFWAFNRRGAWPEIPNFNYDGPPRRLEAHNRCGTNPHFTQLFPQFTPHDYDVGWSPITDVMVGHTTSVCSS